MNSTIEIDTKKYRQKFTELNNKYNISPRLFAQITGIPAELIQQILSHEMVTIKTVQQTLIQQLDYKLNALKDGFAASNPRNYVQDILNNFVHNSTLSVRILAKLLGVTANTIHQFIQNPVSNDLSANLVDTILVNTVLLDRILECRTCQVEDNFFPTIDVQYYQKLLSKINSKYGIDTKLFIEITGVSSDLVKKIVQNSNLDDQQQKSMNQFAFQVIALATDLGDIEPKDRVINTIESLNNNYQLPLITIAQYCKVEESTLKQFIDNPYSNLPQDIIEYILTNTMRLYEILDPNIDYQLTTQTENFENDGDESITINIRYHQDVFRKLDDYYGISPNKFVEITGVSDELVKQITQSNSYITINSSQEYLFHQLEQKLMSLSGEFSNNDPRDLAISVISIFINEYKLSIDTIAKYCKVKTQNIEQFCQSPDKNSLTQAQVERICVNTMFLYRTLDPDINYRSSSTNYSSLSK